MPTAREIAFKILSQWTNLSSPPFLPERGRGTDPHWEALSWRDRAVTFDLLSGIMRWRGTLEAVIGSQLKQPVESLSPQVAALLWLGTYQILFHEGTADYAAVDTTVELAKRNRGAARAGGLINAVLRNIVRMEPRRKPRAENEPPSRTAFAVDFETLVYFNSPVFPNPSSAPDRHLAAATSHPARYVTHLRKIFGDPLAGKILLRDNLRPAVTLRADADSLEVPAAADLAPHADAKRFLVAVGGWNAAIEELVAGGALSPQDPTSAKPIRALRHWTDQQTQSEPASILDLCAGLGTKAIQAAREFPHATITATDIAADKLERLAARAKKIGANNIAALPMENLTGQFDAVLVDVPCSNTGVFGRRVQARWRWPSLDPAAMRNLQLQLLSQAAARLMPRGVILYSTCSIDPAENEKLLYQFLQQAGAGFEIAQEEKTLPSLTSGPRSTRDGGYFAILRRTSAQ